MFLKNAWYVAALDNDIGRELHATTLLGEDVVLYRKSDGTVVALEDSCPHRRLPLSMGRLIGDTIECGYHGLTFDCSGSCVNAPGMAQPPKAAVVSRYPCVSRYGFVWLWMGDPLRADAARIPVVDHWGDPAWGMNRGDAMSLDCHYLYVTDNLLDPSHVSWVHQTSFGSSDMVGKPLNVEVTEQGVTVSRWMHDVEVAPFYQQFVRFQGRCDRKQQYEVQFPGYAIIRAIFTPSGTATDTPPFNDDVFLMDSYNFITPINEHSTRYFWFQMRNFSPDDQAVSDQFSQDVRAAFAEDRVVLNAVHRGMAQRPAAFNLPLDGGPLQFRRRLQKLVDAENATAQGGVNESL